MTNVLPALTCYCAPTSLSAMVYGLVVLFNTDVIQAFQMAESGMPPSEIRAHFAQRRHEDGRPRPDWENT